jgi:hypothetical protein
MTIRFTCDCGKLLQAQEEHAGRLTRCPACGRELSIPQADEASQPSAVPLSPLPVREDISPPARTRDEREEEDRPRPQGGSPRTSGKATAALILGLVSFCAWLLAGIPALVLGILSLKDISQSGGRLKGQGLAIAGLVMAGLSTVLCPVAAIVGLPALLLPAAQKVREAAARTQSSNNLRQIGLALLSYNDEHGRLPPAAIAGRDGRPLLSWRVAVLPHLGQDTLYKQFRLDEPWDSPHNIKLLPQMPKVYAHPAPRTAAQVEHTYYRAITGPGTAFEGPQGLRIGGDFPDGLSNTILIVEAADAVPWTKPDELHYAPGGPLPRLGDHFSAGRLVLLGDASVRSLSPKTSEPTLRAAMTRNGGEGLGSDW